MLYLEIKKPMLYYVRICVADGLYIAYKLTIIAILLAGDLFIFIIFLF
jgi:hypothetical protein